MKELFKKAHQLTKEIKREYPEVDYRFQFGLCLAYLQEEGEKEMIEFKTSKGTEIKASYDIEKGEFTNLIVNDVEVGKEECYLVNDYIVIHGTIALKKLGARNTIKIQANDELKEMFNKKNQFQHERLQKELEKAKKEGEGKTYYSFERHLCDPNYLK